MTGSFISFLNRERPRNSLSVFFINCLSVNEALIIFTWQRYGTHIDAVATGSAFGGINKTGGFVKRNCKITCIAFDFINFSVGNQIDV